MAAHDPGKIFDELWRTFYDRYPFFQLRTVDWNKQYDAYRSKITNITSEEQLFDILCEMLKPLCDGHVELEGLVNGRKRFFTAEEAPRFYREFSDRNIKRLFETTDRTLVAHGFGSPESTAAWMLRYCRSARLGYLRILELEGVKRRKLTAALNDIARDFADLDGFIIDIRDCPGGDDTTAISIINRFCDRKRVAFHRKTKIGPGEDDFTALKTWHIEPEGGIRFTGPIVLLTCDSVFSGGECFALAISQLPHVTIVGDRTNGIFSYQLEKQLSNGWEYRLSYQIYLSADKVCYEGKGVPPDIELLNRKADLETGTDPLIAHALDLLTSGNAGSAHDDR